MNTAKQNSPTPEQVADFVTDLGKLSVSDAQKVESLEQERDAWVETARQYAVNEEYHRQKRFALLRWVRDTCKTYVDIEPLVPEEFKADFKLLDEV